MRTLFTFALALLWLLTGFTSQAQAISNLNLETWSTRNGAEAPDNWQTTDDVLHALILKQYGISTYISSNTVTKTTTAHGGTYAARLATGAVTGLQGLLPGILTLGTKLGPYYVGGVPYTMRPNQIQLYYQLTGPASDSAAVQLLLTNTPATAVGQPNVLGGGIVYLQPTTGGYAQLSLTIPYTSSVTPDSIRLQISSGSATKLTSGTTLLIDDVTFSGTALAIRADAGVQELLTVAPNPSTGGRFTISSPDKPELAAAPYQVLDALGRTVAQQGAQAVPGSPRELDLSALSTGIYLLRLDSKQGTIVRQLTVK